VWVSQQAIYDLYALPHCRKVEFTPIPLEIARPLILAVE
jgi:hypothetical protein